MELFWGGGKLKLVNSLLIPVFFLSFRSKMEMKMIQKEFVQQTCGTPQKENLFLVLFLSLWCGLYSFLWLLYLQSLFFCGMLLQRVWPAFICVVVQKVEDTGEMNTCWKFNRTSVHLWTALVSDLSFQGYMTFFACDVPMYDNCRLQTADRRLKTVNCFH